MRKCAASAVFDHPIFLPDQRIVPRTGKGIQGTIAEKAVDLLQPLMTWIVFTVSVFEVFM